MAQAYRLDVRYVADRSFKALGRVEALASELQRGGFSVSDIAIFDDGMRVSLTATSTSRSTGRNELRLLSLVSNTGTIGRFSCREAEDAFEGREEPGQQEPVSQEPALF